MKTIEVKDILSISGKGGLFRYIAQARNGIVVESLEDKKRHVEPTTSRVSSLEDIAIFTESEDVPLSDVLHRIYEKETGKESISHKSTNEELKNYFEEILPEYDEERVYVSDIRKVINWYNILRQHDMLILIDKEEEKGEEQLVEKEVDKESGEANPEDKKPKKDK